MSLTASMWTSVSGLLAHGEKMNVVGNNISNVNTVGFKSQRMDFQDFVYQSIGTANGTGQVGRGTSIGAIMNDFSQGAYESSTHSMDMHISGNGFFAVKPQVNDMVYYTRAGNFRFDAEGTLVDPHGYALQGYRVNQETGKAISGDADDIKLDTFTCPPKHTTEITIPVNLRNDKVPATDDNSVSADGDTLFAMLKNWDARQEVPLGSMQYAHQTTVEVYDEAGKSHKLTVYFDRVADVNPDKLDGYTDGESYWEYVITMAPTDDVRDFSSQYDPTGAAPTDPDVPEKLKGLLGAGTLTFTSNGTLKDMTAFVPHSDGSAANTWWKSDGAGSVKVDLDKWVAAPIDKNGFPVVAPNFSGTSGLSTAYQDGVWSEPNEHADGMLISVNMGLRSKTGAWQFLKAPDGSLPANYVDSQGNATGLVSASALSRTYDVQAMDDEGKYVWRSSAGFTATSADQMAPSGVWSPAPTGSNASVFYWQLPISGGTITGNNDPATNDGVNLALSTESSPQISFTPAANPDNARSHRYTSTGGFVAVMSRDNLSDGTEIIAPDKAPVGAWTYRATNAAGATIWVSTDPTARVTIPASSGLSAASTSAQVAAAIKGQTWNTGTAMANADPADPTLEHYWTGEIAGASSAIPVTTASGTAPTMGPPVSLGNNATEYYWSDITNPDTVATTTGTPTAQPLPAYPGTVTPFAPTAPTGAWSAQMETVTRSNKFFANGLDGLGELQQIATTCLGDDFYTHTGLRQNGYTYGDLRGVTVGTDGILSASYSNGETLELFQVVLYDFPSTQNLRREGGNLFSETRESGMPSSGQPGTGVFGTTQGYSLEQSNVDLSREFVNMITTQRGFQANSKGITTVDTMLETVINMKR